jgi:DNA mismatch repair protein MutS
MSKNSNTNSITPMMQQWHSCKKKAKDALLFFRLGDFYESFYEDAAVISKELDLTFTKRAHTPMCGVPHHTLDIYVDRLIAKGYKVAIAEQMEDPKKVKGIVKRGISRIVTPGTIVNSNLLSEKSNNFFASITQINKSYGLCILELTTANFQIIEIEEKKDLFNELYKLRPKEFLISKKFEKHHGDFFDELKLLYSFSISKVEDWNFDYKICHDSLLNHFEVISLDGFGLKSMTSGISSAGALINHLINDLQINIDHIKTIHTDKLSKYLQINHSCMRNLEVIESYTKQHSLLKLIDQTQTPMGGRLLSSWVKYPLLDITKIKQRQNAINELVCDPFLLSNLKDALSGIRDLERLIMKISSGYASPRDLLSLRFSIEQSCKIKNIILDLKSNLMEKNTANLIDLSHLAKIIETSICDTPPLKTNDGNIFNDGYNKELDELRAISKGQAKNVGDRFVRRQTLVNAERFITNELKEFEEKALTAQEQIKALESKLYEELRMQISSYFPQVTKIAKAIANIDVIYSFATCAKRYNFICPEINNDNVIDIKNGRHPLIESTLRSNEFIPNDTYLDNDKNNLFIITGPNMAGKSTYIRQVAIITLLAQMGSFVPAKYAKIGIVDKIFSRIGASDDLTRGQSTFMVEMTETANILNSATEKSLIILDEIGRGTSTYDGISIAWAVAQYLLTMPNKRAKTLFATHYWELTALEKEIPGAVNYNVSVAEVDHGIVFLRKIIKGDTDKSYGIHVAKLAGLPYEAIKIAKERLDLLEKGEKQKSKKRSKKDNQFSLFETKPIISKHMESIIEEIKSLDINKLTPIEAQMKLLFLQEKLKTQ